MVAVPERLRYTDISAYARDFGFADSRADLKEFLSIMRALDDVYITHFAETAKAGAKTPPGKVSR